MSNYSVDNFCSSLNSLTIVPTLSRLYKTKYMLEMSDVIACIFLVFVLVRSSWCCTDHLVSNVGSFFSFISSIKWQIMKMLLGQRELKIQAGTGHFIFEEYPWLYCS